MSRTDSPSRLRKYHAHGFLKTVVTYARPPGRKNAPDLREVRVLVGNVLHDHRRDHGVERAVGDLRNGVGGGDDRPDPREARGDAGESRRLQVDRVHRPLRADQTVACRAPRREGRHRSRDRRARAGPVEANVREAWGDARRRSGRRSRCSARSRERDYASVGPAVARLPFAAADLEPAARALERAMPPLHVRAAAQADLHDFADGIGGHAATLGRREDGYDGRSGAVAEWLGRGLQSLVQRFESARRLETRCLQEVSVISGLDSAAAVGIGSLDNKRGSAPLTWGETEDVRLGMASIALHSWAFRRATAAMPRCVRRRSRRSHATSKRVHLPSGPAPSHHTLPESVSRSRDLQIARSTHAHGIWPPGSSDDGSGHDGGTSTPGCR